MHILFLTDNFPPEVNAPASRTHEHCREWVKAGHAVTVITCAPNFPGGKVFDGYRNRLWQREEIDGIRVIRVWSYITANEGFSRRVADYASFMLGAIFAAPFAGRADVIVGTSPQFFTAVAAWVVSGLRWKPWIFELRDIWPESIRAVGAMEDSRVLDALEGLELFLYRRASAIVPVTNAFKDNLVGRGIDGDKIRVVTNGADLTRFSSRPRDPALVEELGLAGCFVAGYIGTMGMAHGLDTLIDAALLLRDDPDAGDVRIVMLGNGAQRAGLEARAKAEGATNMVFVDSVAKEKVVDYWALLDTAIIHLRKSDLFRTVIPSKLFECMAMGIPVLHAVEGESAEIVESEGVGLTVPPEDPGALAEAILRLREDSGLRARLATTGPEAARCYDRSKLAADMLGIIAEVAGKDATPARRG